MEMSVIIWTISAIVLLAAVADMAAFLVRKLNAIRKDFITLGSEREEFYIPGDETDQYDSDYEIGNEHTSL